MMPVRRLLFLSLLSPIVTLSGCVGTVHSDPTGPTSNEPNRTRQISKLPNQASPCEPPELATGESAPSNDDPCKRDPTDPGGRRTLEPPDIHPIQ